MFEAKELLDIKQASVWTTEFLGKSVTPSNISYLINYGRVKKIGVKLKITRGFMNTLETIQQKVHHLPVEAQKEVLEAVEQIAKRYQIKEAAIENNSEIPYPLDLLAEIRIDGPPDLAERHDFYAHGKLED